MAGYHNYSMSNNAVEAYERGEMPISKWSKKAIMEELSKYTVKPEHMAAFKTMSIDELRDKLLCSCGWHHTGKYYNQTFFYSVEYDEDEDYLEPEDTTDIIYKLENWDCIKYNKKRRAFKNISKSEFEAAKEKHRKRECSKIVVKRSNKLEAFKYTISLFEDIPYVLTGNYYQRPSSNGKGYVAVLIGASSRNIYTEDPFVVKALKRRYAEWRKTHPSVPQIPENVHLDSWQRSGYERWLKCDENLKFNNLK